SQNTSKNASASCSSSWSSSPSFGSLPLARPRASPYTPRRGSVDHWARGSEMRRATSAAVLTVALLASGCAYITRVTLPNQFGSNGYSGTPVISADGATIAFSTKATNLLARVDANGAKDDLFQRVGSGGA